MEPFLKTCSEAFERMHRDLEAALDGLPQSALDWVPGERMNSITVLVSHTAGAERYWIGEFIGGEPSGRVRSSEFEQRGVSGEELKKTVRDLQPMIERILPGVTAEALEQERETPANGKTHSGSWALVHMIDHTATHLGHVQLTRQLWEQQQDVPADR